MSDGYQWSQERFNDTLREYLKSSSRTLPDALNTKLFFIGRRAVVETPAADKSNIARQLGTATRLQGGGRFLSLAKGNTQWATFGGVKYRELFLAELIIRARYAKSGKQQPTEAEMRGLVIKMIDARVRSVNYLKAGWLTGIKKLETVIPAKYRRGAAANSPAKVIGKPKGYAIPAIGGFFLRSVLANTIGASGPRAAKQDAALEKYASPGLARAFDFEVASMKQHMETHMKPDADRFNQQQH